MAAMGITLPDRPHPQQNLKLPTRTLVHLLSFMQNMLTNQQQNKHGEVATSGASLLVKPGGAEVRVLTTHALNVHVHCLRWQMAQMYQNYLFLIDSLRW